MDQPINVLWLSYHEPQILARGYWDQGLLEDIFKRAEYKHFVGQQEVSELLEFNRTQEVPEDREGAIVIINGRTHIDDVDKINHDIAGLKWCLFIETGDEEATFPWRDVKHPRMRVWIMMPRMNQHDDVSFHLPNGYRPETREILGSIDYDQRPYDWWFAGQVNHPRREQCLQEINYLVNSGENPNGVLVTTECFGEQKLPYPEYLQQMAQSKIVFCPSGIESADNFRLYEALEAGCLPIVDAFSTKFQTPGFWRYLFGDDLPFPIVNYWDELPKLLPELLRDYPRNANKCFAWWQEKKRGMRLKLQDDIKELSR